MDKLTGNEGTLTPAYGRDYPTAATVKAAFLAGKDFTLNFYNGRSTYCSIRDFVPGATVWLRYKKRTQKTSCRVK